MATWWGCALCLVFCRGGLVPAAMNAPKEEGGGVSRAKGAADPRWAGGCAPAWRWLFYNWRPTSTQRFFPWRRSGKRPARRRHRRGPAVIERRDLRRGGHAGPQAFPLARNAAVAAGGLVLSLRTFGDALSGVWCSFAVFNAGWFAGAFRHHLVTGPWGPGAEGGTLVAFSRKFIRCGCEQRGFRARGDRDRAAGGDLKGRGPGVWGEFGDVLSTLRACSPLGA